MTDSTAAGGVAGAEDREIVVTRVFDAPRERVFAAWTDPDQVVRWWGPRGFTTVISEMDVRAGGVWRFVMRGADGAEFQNKIVYTEVEAPSRIVYDHVSGPKFTMTATFAERDGGTELTMRMRFESSAERDYTVEQFHADDGLGQTADRLGELIATTGGREFAFTRDFDAPRDLVWKAWTEADRLEKWWGPKGLGLRVAELDLRPGGVFLYAMTTPDGAEMYGKFVYRDVVPFERLVFVVSFCDADGTPRRHPLSATWPLEVLSTVELSDHDGGTRIVGRSVPVNATDEERATFEAGFDSMRQGYGGTLDQLAAYVAQG